MGVSRASGQEDGAVSLRFYGAVRLREATAETRTAVVVYWQAMAHLHGFAVYPDLPAEDDLGEDFTALWGGPDWLRFRISQDAEGIGVDGFMLASANAAGPFVKRMPAGSEPRYVWMRLPAWRGLATMLRHEALTEAFLVLEDATGDWAAASDAIQLPVMEALTRIWWDYVYYSTDDANVYRLDLDRPY
jgi:hypothetical protein